ncbi:ScbA/BarX family gamma-butyrolactone biosynthesis protein [Streptomyces sp. NPDC088387]|uniref:ScbA/BarX family gamma-butyrolactone biosynthesis protein n=1 Tax=Streptomyces sp. NPDC088387 TaxID=3365859 RepID=UPI00382C1F3D
MHAPHHHSTLPESEEPGIAEDAGAEPQLSFVTCVPRTMVHKSAVSEVFITDAARTGEHRFAVAAQWPRDHVFFRPGTDGSGDPLLWIETVRQAGIYLSHRFYGIPHSHPFVLSDTAFEVDEPRPVHSSEVPLETTLDITFQVGSADPRRFVAALEAVISVGGRPRGSVTMHWRALDPERYARIRRRAASEAGHVTGPRTARVPMPPEVVGRRFERDMLLTEAPGGADGWQLRLDMSHPVLFDHVSDHIPGMALIEAFRQAGALVGMRRSLSVLPPRAWTLRSGSLSFRTFGELDTPTAITMTTERQLGLNGNESILRASATQGGRTLAEATLCGLHVPAAPPARTATGTIPFTRARHRGDRSPALAQSGGGA